MLHLKKHIKIVEELIKEDTIQSLTYAALECRLTIETICYERLKISYDYLSYDDLRKWQPKNVVKQLVTDANELADEEFSIAIATIETDDKKPTTIKEYKSLNYIDLGTQTKININKLGGLWNALSNLALHVSLPKSKENELNTYGDKEKILRKVEEALSEIKKISEGNMIMGGAGIFNLTYSFNCVTCNTIIKKNIKLLKEIQVVNCISPSCKESYIIKKEGDNCSHSRYELDLICEKCKITLHVPYNYYVDLKFGQSLNVICHSCEHTTEVLLRPFIKKLIE